MIRVLVVDDHNLIRQGIKQILEDTLDIRVAGEASTGHEALEKIRERDWDVVLMDISMPDGSGFETMSQVRSLHPNLPVLMLSMHPEEEFAIRAFRSGASGYLGKDTAANELISAIRKVASGGKFVTPAVAEKLAAQIDITTRSQPHETLSQREFQVFLLLASGKSVSEIADEISLSVKTVSTYRSRILEKMGLRTNAQLTRYAIDNHLVE